MLLVLDMGNTNITLGVYDGDQLLLQSRIATDRTKMEDQYAVELMDLMRLYKLESAAFSGAILSSVVPPLNHALCGAVKKAVGVTPLLVGPGTKTGLNIRIDNPATLGADLLVGAVAAVDAVGYPCIIWDLGTATTVTVVDKDGAFRGGAIMPGIGTALGALADNTSLLPQISVDAPSKVIGTNTISCLQSGAVYGNACMIDGSISASCCWMVCASSTRKTKSNLENNSHLLPCGGAAVKRPSQIGWMCFIYSPKRGISVRRTTVKENAYA